MSIATLVTRGIGPDNSIAAMVLRGFSTAADTGGLLVTRGFGPASTIAGIVLRGFTPTTGTQSVVVCSTTSWSGYSLQESQSPAVVAGDVYYADLVTTPGGYDVVVNTDGTVEVDAGGDTTRQKFMANIYDTSLAAYYGAFAVYINNHGPQLNVQPFDVRVLLGNTMTSLDFTSSDDAAVKYVIDQDKDVMTSALTSGSLPTGVTLSNNVLSGTPSTAINNSITVRFTDTATATLDVVLNFLSDVGIIVPVVINTTSAAAQAAVLAAGASLKISLDEDYSATIASGNVIRVSPAEGSQVFYDSTVGLTLSLGPFTTNVTVPNVVGLGSNAGLLAIQDVGLTGQIQVTKSGAADDTIIAQFPIAGSSVVESSTVLLTVSVIFTEDEKLQNLLDANEDFHGILITSRADSLPATVSYYCQPTIAYPGRAKWIDCNVSWSNQQKADFIIAVLRIPI